MSDLKRFIVDVPDFPQPGILFRDIMPLLREQFEPTIAALDALLDEREWARHDGRGRGAVHTLRFTIRDSSTLIDLNSCRRCVARTRRFVRPSLTAGVQPPGR